MAQSGEYFDLNQLPDSTPIDLYQNQNIQENLKASLNLPLGGTQKALKQQLVGSNNQQKAFTNCNSSQYNSQKNLRNQATLANNRYSSQNMKCFEYDDEKQLQEDDLNLDIADENFTQAQMHLQNQKRTSQRFKDRVRNLRVQSQETCAREGNPGLYREQEEDELGECDNGSDENLEFFERAQQDTGVECILTECNYPNINKIIAQKPDDSNQRWIKMPISNDEFQDDTPKQYEDVNGAHFQYNELLKKLAEIKKFKNEKTSNSKQSKTRGGKMPAKNDNETFLIHQQQSREPLKEKTQDVINQQQLLLSEQKRISGEKKNQSTGKSKVNKEVKRQQNQPHLNIGPTQIKKQEVHSKLTKLILTNQENNFIEKKLKDQSTQSKKKTTSKTSQALQNKSQNNNQKSCEKAKQKSSQITCQINNMKIKQSVNSNSSSNLKNIPSDLQKQNLNQGNHKITIQQKVQQPTLVNPTISQLYSQVTASQSSIGQNNNNNNNNHITMQSAFGQGFKCPSSNFLKTANTAISQTTMMTQSSSNKQIQGKDTPEATNRQKFRLGGTAHSSTSRIGVVTMSNNNSQGNTIGSNFQTVNLQHDSITKRSQNNSDSKHSKQDQASSANRSNSNTTQKVEIKKMMIKNTSFLKQTKQISSIPNQNDFYQTIYQKIQNNNYMLPNGQSQGNTISQTLQRNSSQAKTTISDGSKKSSIVGGSAKINKVNGKVQSQRLSGQGSNHASINSPGSKGGYPVGVDLKSIESSPSQSWTRRHSQNQKETSASLQQPPKIQANNVTTNQSSQMSIHKVNQILKQLQDKTEPLLMSQRPSTNNQQMPGQQSILLTHQLTKAANTGRPQSGKLQKKIEPAKIINRQNSAENNLIQQQQQQHHPMLKMQGNNMDLQSDNRKSLMDQHKTAQKQINQTGISSHQQLKQTLATAPEKVGKYLQKKEELNQQAHNKQQQQQQQIQPQTTTANSTKKGLLIANIMKQKSNLNFINTSHSQVGLSKNNKKQSAYERQHFSTEEDENNDDFNIINDILKFTSMCTEEDEVYNKDYHVKKENPPLSGQRLSQRVKINAKNF